ncbi:hypothetical protein [Corynebacterium sp. HMSC078A10]|uniref:hypothetical protein n=1 Tax=Corynebacterium sp. HMSC078A10 TaxID=1739312 RepID=UPI00114D0F65|nr:hypothetical protein [Corynebacterium sp. HMSC078A10]
MNDTKKDANKYVPKGHYKRHCRGVGQHPSDTFREGEEDLEEAAFNHIIGDEKETYRERFNINDFSQFP